MSSTSFESTPARSFSSATAPTLPLLGLSESEQELIKRLQALPMRDRSAMELAMAYYLGEQVVTNLRIAIPQELEFLRTIVGWPSIGVDPIAERLAVDGFRLPSSTDADVHLAELWDANAGEYEQTLAFTDALAMGRAYWMVGSNPERGGPPVISVESPLNMTVLWDLRGTAVRAAMQEYWDGDRRRGALLVPNQTVHLAQDDRGQWEIVERDEHDFGFVPVERMANRPRTNNRDGRSEISPAVMSLTDSACRTLLGLEVARELYSVPQKAILGASEEAFQKSDGTPKAAWETYITRVLALEADEGGNLPEIHQMKPYDPSVFTKILDWYASAIAGHLAATPQDLGLYTQGNPASAEAVEASEHRRDRRAVLRQRMFSPALARTMQNALRFENKGVLPREYERIATDWHPVQTVYPSLISDAVSKEIAAGAIPATSDVTLKKLGYSAVDRQRLAQDRRADDARTFARAIAAGLLPNPGASGGNADGQ